MSNGNWVRRRAEEGRDVYRDLLALGRRLDAVLCLEATNEVLMQVRRYMPDTFTRLGQAYRAGALHPVYGNAFHTHTALLTGDELADELRLNREYLRDVVGAPEPRHPGAFPMEGSIDARKLDGFRRAGIEYVIFPNLSPRKMRYRFEPPITYGEAVESETRADEVYGAFTIGGEGLLALPRHFPISQEIWRPITKWQPQRLAPQGYILGRYAVLDEEYRSGETVAHPITRESAVLEYTDTLRAAIDAAPDGGLLLYIQDLELMDFGEEALDILGEAWTQVREECLADLRFVTPDTYIDELRASGRPLPRLYFSQASWAPEIRLVLRSDGHYPPLHAGPVDGIDNDEAVFRRWPFIFWETGRFIVETFRSLLESFGVPAELPLSGAQLESAVEGFPDGLDATGQVALHLRAMQRACNFGWQPDEDRHKWPYLHGLAICELLRERLRASDAATRVSRAFRPLPERALRGLDRVLEVIIDTRVGYLRRGIERLGERAGDDQRRAASLDHLRIAVRRRARASALARQLRAENAKFITNCAIDARALSRVLALLQEHCKETYLAINEIQRAWMGIEDTAGMIEEMYAYLHALYPPLFPAILRDLLADGEVAALDAPVLV